MIKTCALGLAALALLSSCGPEARSQSAAPPRRDVETLSVKELMLHVIDPAADGVWENQGWELTAAGERETFPTTDEGWLKAENAAATVAEAANLLLTTKRRHPDTAWLESAAALHRAGIETFRAAEARDKQAFFDAGGRLYEACASCHARFISSPPATTAGPIPLAQKR